MAQVLIRDVDDDVIARLKSRAKGNGRSLAAELRDVLRQAAGASMQDAWAQAERIRDRFAGRVFTDSVDLIREDRER